MHGTKHAVLIASLLALSCSVSPHSPALSGRVILDEPAGVKLKKIIVFASVGAFPAPSQEWQAKATALKTTDQSLQAKFLRAMGESPEGATWIEQKPVYPGGHYDQFSVQADTQGNYSFDALPAGTCFVSAWFEVDTSDAPYIRPVHHQARLESGKTAICDIHLSRFDIVDW